MNSDTKTSTRPRRRILGRIIMFAGCSGAALALAWAQSKPKEPAAASEIKEEAAPKEEATPAVKPDPALERLKNATTMPGADAGAWVALGDGLMQKSREIKDAELYGQAKSAYQKALSLDPKCAEAMLGIAWVHNSRHDFAQGRHWAEKALEANPRMAQAHSLLSDGAVELGDYEMAIEHCQQALRLRPDLSSYSRAAHVMWLTGDVRRAQALMQRAISSGGPYPENVAWCLAEQALMSFQQGALLPAEQSAKRALELAPGNAQAHMIMGKVSAAKGEYDGAIEHHREAIKRHPHPHESLVAVGDIYAVRGEMAEAEKAYEEVIAFHKNHQHGPDAQGKEHIHGNAFLARFLADHDRDLSLALKEAEMAYQSSKNVYVIDALAWCLHKNGQSQRAWKIVREALQRNTPDAAIHYHAGMIALALGDGPEGRKRLSKAINLNPHFDPLQARLAVKALESVETTSASLPATPDTNVGAGVRPPFLSADQPKQ